MYLKLYDKGSSIVLGIFLDLGVGIVLNDVRSIPFVTDLGVSG